MQSRIEKRKLAFTTHCLFAIGFGMTVEGGVKRFLKMVGESLGARSMTERDASDDYVLSAPSAQNALDLFANEWACELPPPLDKCRAGKVAAFKDDSRVLWAEKALGGFSGAKILELGPLEGGHTYMLEKMGAESIRAIESNRRAFQKCLIVKELLGMSRAHFELGDFNEYLKTSQERYDVLFASGVLYHMTEPLQLLKQAAEHAERLFVWTHYYDRARFADKPSIFRLFRGDVDMEHAGFACRGHVRYYDEARNWCGFCGGPRGYSVWMEKAHIVDALKAYGFAAVEVGHETPDHPSGPAFCIAAKR